MEEHGERVLSIHFKTELADMSIQRKATERIELVETHNLAISLSRIYNLPHQSCWAWRRALMHAIQMSGVECGWEEQKIIREALKLP